MAQKMFKILAGEGGDRILKADVVGAHGGDAKGRLQDLESDPEGKISPEAWWRYWNREESERGTERTQRLAEGLWRNAIWLQAMGLPGCALSHAEPGAELDPRESGCAERIAQGIFNTSGELTVAALAELHGGDEQGWLSGIVTGDGGEVNGEAWVRALRHLKQEHGRWVLDWWLAYLEHAMEWMLGIPEVLLAPVCVVPLEGGHGAGWGWAVARGGRARIATSRVLREEREKTDLPFP